MSHKVFKIERRQYRDSHSGEDRAAHPHDNQMLDAIAEIRTMLAERMPGSGMQEPVLDQFRADMMEAAKIKIELVTIQKAIERTKLEIAALHMPGDDARDISRMTDELGAIVSGTERATETILAAVEKIEEDSNNLSASVRSKQQRDTVADIQEQVVSIYEACNFQDLTGQRISKVIRAFGFIELHVHQMMEIWGGIESFKGLDPAPRPGAVAVQDGHLLNGPPLAHDSDVASQDEIDALFD